MRFVRRWLDEIVLLAGLIAFALFLQLPAPGGDILQIEALKISAAVFRGEFPQVDITADIIGFRGLYFGTDPYPILGPAARELGLDWNVNHPNTHPPTAFLFAAPIAFLPLAVATSIWAFASLAGLFAAFALLRLPWKRALGAAGLILWWPPAAMSVGQLTIIWFLAAAFGWRLTDRHSPTGRHSLAAGAVIAIASLTKLFPAFLLMPHLLRRDYRAFAAFVGVWLAALALVTGLHADALPRFFEIGAGSTMLQVARPDNASLLALAYRLLGFAGVTLVVAFLALVAVAVLKAADPENSRDRERLWMASLYLSVALVPIAWVYSFLPLVPVILYMLGRRTRASVAAGLAAIVVPVLVPSFGPLAGLLLPTATLALGLAFIADGPGLRFSGAWFGAGTGRFRGRR